MFQKICNLVKKKTRMSLYSYLMQDLDDRIDVGSIIELDGYDTRCVVVSMYNKNTLLMLQLIYYDQYLNQEAEPEFDFVTSKKEVRYVGDTDKKEFNLYMIKLLMTKQLEKSVTREELKNLTENETLVNIKHQNVFTVFMTGLTAVGIVLTVFAFTRGEPLGLIGIPLAVFSVLSIKIFVDSDWYLLGDITGLNK